MKYTLAFPWFYTQLVNFQIAGNLTHTSCNTHNIQQISVIYTRSLNSKNNTEHPQKSIRKRACAKEHAHKTKKLTTFLITWSIDKVIPWIWYWLHRWCLGYDIDYIRRWCLRYDIDYADYLVPWMTSKHWITVHTYSMHYTSLLYK